MPLEALKRSGQRLELGTFETTGAYDVPGFLTADEDFLSVYRRCIKKPIEELTLCNVRECITFPVRQMRCAYPSYRCITDGSLANLLMRWVKVVMEENKA